MNVGELKKKLEQLPDNLEVLTSDYDHSYRAVYVSTKMLDKDGRTYYDPDLDGGKHLAVVIE